MNDIRQHSIYLSSILFLFLLACIYSPWTSLILACTAWVIRMGRKGLPAVLVLFLFMMIPRTDFSSSAMNTGRVIEVKSNYAVIQNHEKKIILYTGTHPVLDSVISFDSSAEKIVSSKGFYHFNFSEYCQRRGIYYSASSDNWIQVKESVSLRGKLQMRILKESAEKQEILNQILLGIKAEDGTFESALMNSGFPLSGIILFLQKILSYLTDEKTGSRIIHICTLFLCLFYHFPLILLQKMIRQILSGFHWSSQEKLGISLLITMILCPYCVTSAGFLLPAAFRLTSMYSSHPKITSLTAGMMIQSILFHSVNPLQMLLYPVFVGILGCFWIICIFSLIVPDLSINALFLGYDHILKLMDLFAMNGSMIGFGILFFLTSALLLIKRRNASFLICLLFLIYQCFGLFHPFAEVTFINVGQGDSILIRAPMNQCNVLVDTGKPSQINNLSTFLNAKSIRKIQTLFITHSDNDHSGNQSEIEIRYHTDETIVSHQKRTETGPFVFYDLNCIVNEDENQSSLILLTSINHLNILLTGDADQTAEEIISREYSGLHADILKLSHHGSRTGSSDLFLDTVRPNLAVISSGAYKIYHHPSPETVQRLLKRHICSLDTKEEGDISVFFLPHINFFLTSTGKIGIIHPEYDLSDKR